MPQTESGKSLGTAYYRRAYPKVLRAKKLLESGAIGKPVLAELTSHSWLDGHGSREWLVDPAQSGGGPLYDIGSHRIDLLNFFFGEPVRAIGSLSNAVHTYPVEDNATVLVDYPNGVRGIVDVRWHSKVVRDECRIRGTDGEIDMNPLNGPELIHPGGHESLAAHPNLHFPIIQNAVDSFLDGCSVVVDRRVFHLDRLGDRARREKLHNPDQPIADTPTPKSNRSVVSSENSVSGKRSSSFELLPTHVF